jgi:hypothetical protein
VPLRGALLNPRLALVRFRDACRCAARSSTRGSRWCGFETRADARRAPQPAARAGAVSRRVPLRGALLNPR